jgi:hypothetical protein
MAAIRNVLAQAAFIAAVLGVAIAAAELPPPTPEEYVQKVGGDARFIPAGTLTIDGHKVICGQRPTVMDGTLDDYAAAYPGFLLVPSSMTAKSKGLPE